VTFLRKIAKYLLLITAFGIIVFALLLNAARIATPYLDKERPYLEKWVTNAIHQPVTIGKFKATWHGFEPEFTFSNVIAHHKDGTGVVLKIQSLSVGIDVVNSLLQRKLLPGHLIVSGIHLDIVQTKNGRLIIRGVGGAQYKKGK